MRFTEYERYDGYEDECLIGGITALKMLERNVSRKQVAELKNGIMGAIEDEEFNKIYRYE